MRVMKFGKGLLLTLLTLATTLTLVLVSACGGATVPSGGPGRSVRPAGKSNITLSRATATEPATWKPIDVPDKLRCSGPAPDPRRGITDTSIKVGGLGTLSNAGLATFGEAENGARARFERENAAGGVFGRKIDFIGVSDDAANAQQNADIGKKLAENEKVFAAAPIVTPFPNYADALCKNVVPGFGFAFNDGMCNRANLFGPTGCLLPGKVNTGGVGPFVDLLKDSADKSVMLLGIDTGPSIHGIEYTTATLERAGLDVVDTYTKLPPGQPPADPSALIRKIMTANHGKPPAMVYHITDFVTVMAVTQALTAAGYQGVQISAVGYDPRLTALPAFDKAHTIMQWLPFEASDDATVKQMTADLEKYGGGVAHSLVSAMGWLSADMLIEGLKKTGRDLTVDTFLATLNRPDFHYGDGRFMGVTNWPQNHFYGVPCLAATQLKDGKYHLAVPLTCNDPFTS
jgi:ABC-type branched-subunit amino acid transport system substrate-binding protein